MTSTLKLACLAALATGVAGCATSTNVSPSADAAMSPQQRWEAGQAAYLAWNARRSGWQTTESGLQYKCIERGPAIALFQKFGFKHGRTREIGGRKLLDFYIDLYSDPRG